MLAVSTRSGFIDGIITGFLDGCVTNAISKGFKLLPSMEALKAILIIPLLFSVIVGLPMIYLIGALVAKILAGLPSLAANHGDGERRSARRDPRRHDVYRYQRPSE